MQTADWDVIREVKQAVCIPVFANGDVAEPEDAVRILAHTVPQNDRENRSFPLARAAASAGSHH